MDSGKGVLTFDDGDSMDVIYSITESVFRAGVTIAGSIADADPIVLHNLLGKRAALKLGDGRHLLVIFNKPPAFVATGGYF